MHPNSTEIRRFMVEHNCFILFEKRWPESRLKDDYISLTSEDDLSALKRLPRCLGADLRMTRETFDDLFRANLIRQDGPESEGRIVFRLTQVDEHEKIGAATSPYGGDSVQRNVMKINSCEV